MDALNGLKSLTTMASESDQLIYLRPDQIEPDPEQDRRDWDDPGVIDYLKEMAESVGEQGIRRPIEVKLKDNETDRWVIIAGEVRWRSAVSAGLDSVPCLWRKKITSEQASIDMLTENVNKKGLKIMEVARGLRRRLDQGIDRDQLAKATGKSASWVSRRLSLLKMHDDVLLLAESGAVTDPDSLLAINKLSSADREKAIAGIEKGHAFKDVIEKLKSKKATKKPAKKDLSQNGSTLESTGQETLAGMSLSADQAIKILSKYEPDLYSDGDDVADAWALFLENI